VPNIVSGNLEENQTSSDFLARLWAGLVTSAGFVLTNASLQELVLLHAVED
jgi:hypothetical protein